jgi:hypothetical protein
LWKTTEAFFPLEVIILDVAWKSLRAAADGW